MRGAWTGSSAGHASGKARRRSPHQRVRLGSGFEPLEPRALLSGTPLAAGVEGFAASAARAAGDPSAESATLVAVARDLDDQVGEAMRLASFASEDLGPHAILAASGTIDVPTDVDLYAFTAKAGERWGFDIDRTPASRIDSVIRLFNAQGTALARAANDNGTAPGEPATPESYLAYTFSKSGTYYLGVSGRGNSTYSAATGAGDRSGTTGEYRLYAAPVSYTVGQVDAPVPVRALPVRRRST